jgi:hypothetical protein
MRRRKVLVALAGLAVVAAVGPSPHDIVGLPVVRICSVVIQIGPASAKCDGLSLRRR